MAHISDATHNQYQDGKRQHLLPQSQVVVLIVEPTLSPHQHSEYEEADSLRMSSLHQAPVIGSHLSVSQVTVGILQEGAVLMTMIHISIHLTQCRCIHLPSRFLRHSQIFEQLFVLINTKEVFWNMQALKYR